MPDDLEEIMSYLGMGGQPPAPQQPQQQSTNQTGSGTLLASTPSATLWLSSNNNAEWIEVKGSFAVVRATRPKARLIVSIHEDIQQWAEGAPVNRKAKDLIVSVQRHNRIDVLEVRYRTWKPLRLSVEQARAVSMLFEPIKAFASS